MIKRECKKVFRFGAEDRMSLLEWRLKHISSDGSRLQAQTNSPSASPADPPFAPGIELGLPHYTVAMGTLTPPLTKCRSSTGLAARVLTCAPICTGAICELRTG